VALALNPNGEREVLGLRIEQAEGVKFWPMVVNDPDDAIDRTRRQDHHH
jgi:hypothetical protein